MSSECCRFCLFHKQQQQQQHIFLFSFILDFFLGEVLFFFVPYDLSSIDYNNFSSYCILYLYYGVKKLLSFHRYVFFNVSDVFMVIFWYIRSVIHQPSPKKKATQHKTDIIYYIICKNHI